MAPPIHPHPHNPRTSIYFIRNVHAVWVWLYGNLSKLLNSGALVPGIIALVLYHPILSDTVLSYLYESRTTQPPIPHTYLLVAEKGGERTVCLTSNWAWF